MTIKAQCCVGMVSLTRVLIASLISHTKFGDKKLNYLVPLDSFLCSLNFFLARGDFYHLLIAFANSLGPDLDPNCLSL